MTTLETTVWSPLGCKQQHNHHIPYDIRTSPESIHKQSARAQGCKPQISYRGGGLKPAYPDLGVLSWNVEGLTDEKLEVLQVYMVQMKVGIVAVQETHTCNSDYYVTHRGCLVILSGPVGEHHDSAGVGFIVAPWLRRSVAGFCQASSRMASLKVRIKGGRQPLFLLMPHILVNTVTSGRNFTIHSGNSLQKPKHMVRHLFWAISMPVFIDACLEKRSLFVMASSQMSSPQYQKMQTDTC